MKLDIPLHFKPSLINKIWGGDFLLNRLAINRPSSQEKVGESLEIADDLLVLNGPYKNKRLKDLLKDSFPLMLKIIAPKQDLSIQVHPDLKHEAWYILDCPKKAKIGLGLKRGFKKEDLLDATHKGHVFELIKLVTVAQGEVFDIPPGTVHFLGANVKVIEIQQNCNITYRIFDWNRSSNNGESRELHIDKAMPVINLHSPQKVKPTIFNKGEYQQHKYIQNEKFCFEIISDFKSDRISLKTDNFHILTLVKGQLEVWANGERVRLSTLDSCLLFPEVLNYTIFPSRDAKVLFFTI